MHATKCWYRVPFTWRPKGLSSCVTKFRICRGLRHNAKVYNDNRLPFSSLVWHSLVLLCLLQRFRLRSLVVRNGACGKVWVLSSVGLRWNFHWWRSNIKPMGLISRTRSGTMCLHNRMRRDPSGEHEWINCSTHCRVMGQRPNRGRLVKRWIRWFGWCTCPSYERWRAVAQIARRDARHMPYS